MPVGHGAGVDGIRSRARMAYVGAMALIATAALSGCGSDTPSDTPAGINTSEAKSLNDAQFSAADAAAKTVLAPVAGSFLHGKTTVTTLASTTPDNGDVNPYAIWPVKADMGSLRTGDVLVDNFNNKSNNQGTGTTIVDVHPDKSVSVFATIPPTLAGCPGGVGLTTAMVVLRDGWVLVGSLPSTDGKIDTSNPGCLVTLSPTGQVAGTLAGDYLNGPWDATVADNGDTATLFVTTTLNGVKGAGGNVVNKGSVVRLGLSQTPTKAPVVTSHVLVADTLPEQEDASAFVKGPTGLALDPSGALYVGDNLGNRVAVIPDALTRADSAGAGTTLSSGGQLANPLGMDRAPNGNLLVANAKNGKIVEISTTGTQLGEYFANEDVGQDPPGNGDLFDIAVNQSGTGIFFVNDDTNTLALLHG